MKRHLALVLLLAALSSGAASAQQTPAQLIAEATRLYDEFRYDSAEMLLGRVLSATPAASSGQRANAYLLHAMVRWGLGDRPGARMLLRQALQADSTVRPDSNLVVSDLVREFHAARAVLGQASPSRACSTAPTALTIAPSTLSLAVGARSRLNLSGRDALGAKCLPAGARWQSSDVNIARADSSGVVTAVAPGVAVITARTLGAARQEPAQVVVSVIR